MKPWIPAELRAIEQALTERVASLLAPGEHLSVSGADTGSAVQARFVLEGGADGARVELEAKVEPARAGVPLDEARDLALDALDLILGEYLDSQRALRFSGVWQERELQGKPVAVRAERTFPSLEAQADALLGESD